MYRIGVDRKREQCWLRFWVGSAEDRERFVRAVMISSRRRNQRGIGPDFERMFEDGQRAGQANDEQQPAKQRATPAVDEIQQRYPAK